MTHELLKPEKLLFVRKSLEANDVQGLAGPLERPGDADLRSANISILLPLLHEARDKDGKNFWIDLFLPWISIQSSVRAQHERILDEFARIGDFKHDSQKFLIHLVNVYRSIVSDLFDPYMTLLVACFQFIEREFTNIKHANVGLGERNKVEYLKSRIRRVDPENRLLSGYEPIVRNAVAHAGSDGVVYRTDGVLFRNIKRGSPAAVETVEWLQDTLVDKIVRLYECIISIDAAVNVFGVDCGELMLKDEDVKSEFIQTALTPERRAELRAPFEDLMQRIRGDKNLTDTKRFELLSQVLLYNCANRKMPVHGIRVSTEKRTVMVELSDSKKDLSNDEVLRDAVMECCHYAILTRSIFGSDFERFTVRTVLESGQPRLTIMLAGKLLEEYIEERAGLYDLLNEVDIRLNGTKIAISIDFDKVAEVERKSLERTFPRKAQADRNS
ncbi:MAG TPA: hypothetical protein VNO32_03175 [Candidatus Acidoferrum sp.]|nr:hypothetical protein [Candidatus Acidoferrum sp.]